MEQINIFEAKTRLSQLIAKVLLGEEIVIARHGKPVVRLLAYTEPSKKPRKLGGLKGKYRMAPDFDDPLPPSIFLGE